MRVPVRWLRQYVELPSSVDDLAERLTLSGIEVEAIEVVGASSLDGDGDVRGLRRPWKGLEGDGPVLRWDPDSIVIGKVLSVEPHPDADRLSVARIETGKQTLQIVHGAPNLPPGSQGELVVVALPGAEVFDAHSEGSEAMTVAATRLRGIESQGMLCSEQELGLSHDHSGVLLLDAGAPVGTPLKAYLADEILLLELTPNLGRCLSIVGVAREIAGLTGGTLSLPEATWTPQGSAIDGRVEVEIEAPELSPRYTAALIEDLDPGVTPFEMRYRLLLSGMRPLHPVVDITNYLMLEWGQPLHAFDYDRLSARAAGRCPVITVRRARSGERITTLDGVERSLQEEMLVIADEAGPIAIAGVMGGAETEVRPETERVLLESATFHPINNRHTAEALLLPSEASKRYSRGVPEELAPQTAMRAAQLLSTVAGGTVAEGLVDRHPAPNGRSAIAFSPTRANRLLGLTLEAGQAIEALRQLGFEAEERSHDEWSVSVPPWRLDIEGEADLIEEVARVVGYDRLPTTRLADELPPPHPNGDLMLEERVRDLLVGAGLVETVNYSLTSAASEARLSMPAERDTGNRPIELANPISSERTQLRTTLANGLLETLVDNQRHSERVALFEIGRVFLAQEADPLPCEPHRLAIVLAGPRQTPSWCVPAAAYDFFDLKGLCESLFAALGIEDAALSPLEDRPFHPGRAGSWIAEEAPLGQMGELHPEVAEAFGAEGRVLLAELDLDLLGDRSQTDRPYRPIPRYPGILQDLAIVVDESTAASEVERVIREAGGPWLEGLSLFDEYRGEQVPAGKKSLAYTLRFRASDRTLTDEDVESAQAEIRRALERRLSAAIRGPGD